MKKDIRAYGYENYRKRWQRSEKKHFVKTDL